MIIFVNGVVWHHKEMISLYIIVIVKVIWFNRTEDLCMSVNFFRKNNKS